PLARLIGAEADEQAGEPADQRSAREAFFGTVRMVLEALAEEGPLVLVWEDIHWADEGTLDLIEYLCSWLRAPILQVCLAREDLLERRPGWTTTRRTVSVVFLEPLASSDSRALIDALLRSAGADTALQAALAERCGGNPLFAEEIVQRIIEDGEGAAI